MGSAEQLTLIPDGSRRRDRRAAPLGIRTAWALVLTNTLARGVLVSLLSLAAWSLAPAAFGMTSTTVMSGSMVPVIEAGDVVVTHPAAAADLRVGAVLLVDDPDHAGRLRLHRVVAVQDGRLRLRGDANTAPDSSTVSTSQVHGMAFLRVPLAGLPLLWARTGQWPRVALFAAGSATLMALGRLDRRVTTRRGQRGAAPTGTATAAVLALVLVAASSAPAPVWSGFNATTRPPRSTFATDVFPCLTESRLPAGLPAPSIDYRFPEPSGDSTKNLAVGGVDGQLLGFFTRLAGSCAVGQEPGVVLGDGSTNGVLVAQPQIQAPNTLTMAVWFKTASSGGLLAGFGASSTAAASPAGAFDRQLTLNSDGSLTFRVLSLVGSTAGINTPVPLPPSRGYADDQWHQAVITLSGALDMSLYVDGALVKNAVSLSLSSYRGYFRFGYDSVLGGAAGGYRGSMTGVQVWTSTALGAADVAKLYAAGR